MLTPIGNAWTTPNLAKKRVLFRLCSIEWNPDVCAMTLLFFPLMESTLVSHLWRNTDHQPEKYRPG